ncbi:MAG TPA: DEAD/DEAH box helicase family protein [Vicinamibacterales bacterium]|nr:DEAD/DEAH box helicase family protein [Vicinamibacterales bacterium]
MMQLRPYQQDAVDAVYAHLRERDDNPVVAIPTGGGKTPVIATMCRDAVGRWNGRVLILAHVKELLEQALDKLQQVAPEMWHQIGVYSAGLKSRDTEHPIIVAGIQSVYRRACDLDRFDLVIVDEAHMIPPDGDGMYRTFLEEARKINPNLRVIGLTATPFRMTTGPICGPDNVLNSVCYEIGVRELIVQGYLCQLVSKGGREDVDTGGLHVRGGEFMADEVEALMDKEERVESACKEIVDYTRDRNSCLVFTSGVQHARHVAEVLRRSEPRVETVFGETSDEDRARAIGEFRAGRVKYLVNVNVLTHGFDAPNVDCVAMLRPTMSPGLYYQMAGRGFRLCDSKKNCLILDFGGNVLRHGPVDAIRTDADRKGDGDGEAPAKKCPQCNALIAMGYATCPQCGFVFPPPERRMHDAKAGTAGILSDHVEIEEHAVQDVRYSVHEKRDAPPDAPRTMRVEYQIGWQRYISEWICVEHTGYARAKAESWWRRRSNVPIPDTAEEAVRLAEAGALCGTQSITVRSVAGEKYDRITGYALGEKPSYREPGWDDEEPVPVTANGEEVDDDDLPF